MTIRAMISARRLRPLWVKTTPDFLDDTRTGDDKLIGYSLCFIVLIVHQLSNFHLCYNKQIMKVIVDRLQQIVRGMSVESIVLTS